MTLARERIEISGVSIELVTGGSGPALLFLHGGFGLAGHEAFLGDLSRSFRVLAPCLPGFEHSALPLAYDCVDDLAYFCLDLAKQLDLHDVTLVGACFGGWVAAEIAIRSTSRITRLVLINALGAKFGGHLDRDITDIHAMYEADVVATLHACPARAQRDIGQLDDAELTAIVRNREAFALFGWKPYMHSASLVRWLHRVDVPTLILWGTGDGMVSVGYGQRYAAAIPGARFETIEDAGHFPGMEQPAGTARRVRAFTGMSA